MSQWAIKRIQIKTPLRNISANPIRRNANEAMLGIRLSDFKLWTGWKTGVFPSAEENRQRDFCVNRTFLFFPPLRYNVLAKEDFAMKDEFITRVGVWGQRHYNYLKNHFPTVINVMRMNGTLEQYLKDIDKDAQDMFDKLTKQLADSEGINEELKSAKEIEWIRSMNSIRNRAEEIVLSEVIYN